MAVMDDVYGWEAVGLGTDLLRRWESAYFHGPSRQTVAAISLNIRKNGLALPPYSLPSPNPTFSPGFELSQCPWPSFQDPCLRFV